MLCLGHFWYLGYSGGEGPKHKTSKPNTTFLFVKDIIPGIKTEINGIFQVMEGLCIKNNNTKVIEYNMWSEKSFLSCAK